MASLTMIGRVVDGLPLAASMPSDEQNVKIKISKTKNGLPGKNGKKQTAGHTNRNIQEYQNQVKSLFKKLTERSPNKCSIESGSYVFHYSIENGVCFLVMTEKNFSKRSAFSYLEDIQSEFSAQYGGQVPTARRPYCFIEFDTYMQKAKKSLGDSRNGRNRNLSRITDELQGVQQIMIQNIDDVLQRGETLSALDDKAGQLRFQSDKYKKDAKYLNLRTVYAKYAAIGILFLILIIYVRYWWL